MITHAILSWGCNSICVALQIAGEFEKCNHALNPHCSHSPENPGNIRVSAISFPGKVTQVNQILKGHGNAIEIALVNINFTTYIFIYMYVQNFFA